MRMGLSWRDQCSSKKRHQKALCLCLPLPPLPPLTHKEEVMWTHSEKVPSARQKKELSLEPNHADTLISDFQPRELREKKYLLSEAVCGMLSIVCHLSLLLLFVIISLLLLLTFSYWGIIYLEENAQNLRVQLKEFSIRRPCVITTQNKKQKIFHHPLKFYRTSCQSRPILHR